MNLLDRILGTDGRGKGNVKWSREKFKLEKAGISWKRLDGVIDSRF
jgi:hypothetical protein